MQTDDELFNFPCEFPIKAMGETGGDFKELVTALVRKHAPDLPDEAVRARLSQGGRYMSVTVTVQAQSRRQLDDIYMELTAEERVLIAL